MEKVKWNKRESIWNWKTDTKIDLEKRKEKNLTTRRLKHSNVNGKTDRKAQTEQTRKTFETEKADPKANIKKTRSKTPNTKTEIETEQKG